MKKESFLKIFETLTVVGFGLAYWKFDLHIATIVLIVLLTLFVGMVKALGQKLSKLQLVSWLAVLILGGATVLLKDEVFIKWKPSVVNGSLALVFLITQFVGKRSLVERMIGEKVPAPAGMLRKVNGAAALFLFFMGVVNIVVANTFSTTVWVQFKIFGTLVLDAGFLAACLYYLRDYLGDLLEKKPQDN